MISRVINKLKSLKLTIALIICLATLFLLGLIVPQHDIMGSQVYADWKMRKPALVGFLEFVGLTDIYVAPITLAVWALFFLNLVTVMSARIPSIWRRCVDIRAPGGADALRSGTSHATVGMDIGGVADALRAMRFKVFSGGGAFRAVKNRFAPLATIMFHLSFLLLLIGGTMTFYTRFRAQVDLAVGETFTGNYDRTAKPKVGDIPRTAFQVLEVTPTYYNKDLPVDVAVTLKTRHGVKRARINRPYREDGLSFVIQSLDVTPLFVLEDAGGRELDGAYVKLKAIMGNEDIFSMGGYDFRTKFFTDIQAGSEKRANAGKGLPQALKQAPSAAAGTQSKEILNPAFYVNVSEKGKLLGEKTIRPGEAIEFDGHRLVFRDLTYWVRFYVGKESGLGIVYTGFILITLALVIRFFFYRREIVGVQEGGEVRLAGRAEYFPSLYEDEFEAVVKRLEGK